MNAARVEKTRKVLHQEAEDSGYHLNPDSRHTMLLVKGLLTNDSRYGYRSCPCRLASGTKQKDADIVCPCDYRDSDLNDYGTCYCGLYVSSDISEGKKKVKPIPERRKRKIMVRQTKMNKLRMPVWRCKVCGYLCAREKPPETCPVCKAVDRFERFI